MSKFTILSLAAVALCAGCSVFKPAVPTTEISATVAGQKFKLKNPKNTTATNIVCEVQTNGTARLSIGAFSSANDSNVIDAAYAGQAAVLHEIGGIAHQAVTDAVQAAGTAAGAAAKSP